MVSLPVIEVVTEDAPEVRVAGAHKRIEELGGARGGLELIPELASDGGGELGGLKARISNHHPSSSSPSLRNLHRHRLLPDSKRVHLARRHLLQPGMQVVVRPSVLELGGVVKKIQPQEPRPTASPPIPEPARNPACHVPSPPAGQTPHSQRVPPAPGHRIPRRRSPGPSAQGSCTRRCCTSRRAGHPQYPCTSHTSTSRASPRTLQLRWRAERTQRATDA
mmetsp:Transcript_96324/g.257603  ORF Transcript_96324/g.257603 Transcript_96324/m.257603 type:complete len:221 (-) Transcript_96324:45-707(-)